MLGEHGAEARDRELVHAVVAHAVVEDLDDGVAPVADLLVVPVLLQLQAEVVGRHREASVQAWAAATAAS
ncbi:hypothetical protein D3C74_473920 [compost metagenome]